jgi:hypothetical protein
VPRVDVDQALADIGAGDLDTLAVAAAPDAELAAGGHVDDDAARVRAAAPVPRADRPGEERGQDEADADGHLGLAHPRGGELLFGATRPLVLERHVRAHERPADDGEHETDEPDEEDGRLSPRLARDVELGQDLHDGRPCVSFGAAHSGLT